MKKIALILITGMCMVLISLSPAPAQDTDVTAVAEWITQLQFAAPGQPGFGAVRIHHTPGYIDPDQNAYFLVASYNAHLAVLGILDTEADSRLEVARRWITSYLNHLNMDAVPAGIVYDHWYLAGGAGETTAPAGMDPDFIDYDDGSDS